MSEVNTSVSCEPLSDASELIRIQEAISYHLKLKSITDNFLYEFTSSIE